MLSEIDIQIVEDYRMFFDKYKSPYHFVPLHFDRLVSNLVSNVVQFLKYLSNIVIKGYT